MSRFAEALRRATADSTGDLAADDRSGEPLRVFTPNQPAAVPPWQVRIGTVRRRTEPEHSQAAGRFELPFGESTEKLVVSAGVAPVVRKQYDGLAAALHEAQIERGVKVVMVASALPQEGKTLTAVNLALTFSQSCRRRVLLIDADLRRPTIHDVFGVSKAPGLSDSLAGEGHPPPLVQLSPWLSLLPAGEGDGDPMRTLTSDGMRAVIKDAREEFDWVILDTAAIELLPDARLLASMSDCAVLVARAGKTAYDVIQRAAGTLGRDRILGVVLNR
jgi:capsular exopolysaccharide synthesis family protein